MEMGGVGFRVVVEGRVRWVRGWWWQARCWGWSRREEIGCMGLSDQISKAKGRKKEEEKDILINQIGDCHLFIFTFHLLIIVVIIKKFLIDLLIVALMSLGCSPPNLNY